MRKKNSFLQVNRNRNIFLFPLEIVEVRGYSVQHEASLSYNRSSSWKFLHPLEKESLILWVIGLQGRLNLQFQRVSFVHLIALIGKKRNFESLYWDLTLWTNLNEVWSLTFKFCQAFLVSRSSLSSLLEVSVSPSLKNRREGFPGPILTISHCFLTYDYNQTYILADLRMSVTKWPMRRNQMHQKNSKILQVSINNIGIYLGS